MILPSPPTSRRSSMESIVNAVSSVGAVVVEFDSFLAAENTKLQVDDDVNSIVSELEHLHDLEQDLNRELDGISPCESFDEHRLPISCLNTVQPSGSDRTSSSTTASDTGKAKQDPQDEPQDPHVNNTAHTSFLERLALAMFGFYMHGAEPTRWCDKLLVRTVVQGGMSLALAASIVVSRSFRDSKFLPICLTIMPPLTALVEVKFPDRFLKLPWRFLLSRYHLCGI